MSNSNLADELNKLDGAFRRMTNEDEKLAALTSLIEKTPHNEQMCHLQATSDNAPSAQHHHLVQSSSALLQFASSHGLIGALGERLAGLSTVTLEYGSSTPPLDHILCANHDVTVQKSCKNDGVKTCGACRLVKYCSKECQAEHWKIHRQDCKSNLRADSWQPHWILENRAPSFISGEKDPLYSSFGAGMSLCGNIPAIDILNLKSNEGANRHKDMSLAFAASGDLRNVVQTVNGLPHEYRGSLNIVLNDLNPITVVRNILILVILGKLSDEAEAAEHALHLWYSAFLPASFVLRVLTKIKPTLEDILSSKGSVALTTTAKIHPALSDRSIKFFTLMTASPALDPGEANNAVHRTMLSPERMDYRDRYFSQLKPSHRVAYKEWLNFGVLSPFGASNAHLNFPNRWLFLPDGTLCLNDGSSPVQGWDLSAVFESGQKHGTTREDLMGCVFFHVKDQLFEFSRRLRRFKVQIHVFDCDARELPAVLRKRSLTQFDRIEVSNITDHAYVGIRSVLEHWSPLLNPRNDCAAIIGLFMNWPSKVPDGIANGSSSIARTIVRKYAERFPDHGKKFREDQGGPFSPITMGILGNLEVLHNNSPGFEKYMLIEKEARVLEKTGMKRRKINKIVPHRVYARLGSPSSSLPDVESDERLYECNSLSGLTRFERYVEWTRK